MTVPEPVTVPEMLVCPSVIGLLTARPLLLVWLPITTADDAALTVLPVAVAFAVTDVPDDKLNPDFVQEPDAFEVVVPTEIPFAKTSMIVPLASVVVPVIELMVVAVQ